VFESRGYWHPEFKSFFDKVISHSSLTSGTPVGALRTYWKRRISSTIQKALVRGIIAKTKRVNSPAFHDKANYSEAIIDESEGDVTVLEELALPSN
jgi:hypothetical protein